MQFNLFMLIDRYDDERNDEDIDGYLCYKRKYV
jgi:hypothetical protein